jgi:methionyl-tRNA formyltransferase
MRIVFVGTVEFSAKMLCKLISIEANIVGVVTKNCSNFNSDYCDLAPICDKARIPYIKTTDVNSGEAIDWIRSLNPNVIFCFGWSNLIKKDLLNLTELGVIGFHPAQLPFNRGRHPIIWALALGLSKTASTFFIMDEGADSGDILSQETVNISYEDDARSLYNKIIDIAAIQLEQIHLELKNHAFARKKQDDKNANYWRRRTKQDGLINFNMSSRAIYNLTRALTKPYVGAHIIYKQEEVSIWKVEEIPSKSMDNIEPGKILRVFNDSIDVKCYGGAVRIIDHEFKNTPEIGEYL